MLRTSPETLWTLGTTLAIWKLIADLIDRTNSTLVKSQINYVVNVNIAWTFYLWMVDVYSVIWRVWIVCMYGFRQRCGSVSQFPRTVRYNYTHTYRSTYCPCPPARGRGNAVSLTACGTIKSGHPQQDKTSSSQHRPPTPPQLHRLAKGTGHSNTCPIYPKLGSGSRWGLLIRKKKIPIFVMIL